MAMIKKVFHSKEKIILLTAGGVVTRFNALDGYLFEHGKVIWWNAKENFLRLLETCHISEINYCLCIFNVIINSRG